MLGGFFVSKLKKLKSRFFRFFLVLPVIVCLVFSFVPLCVNAETSGRPPHFPDINDSISWAGGENYLIFQGIQTSGNATYACSYVFHFNGDNGYYSISDNDTSYTLSYNYSDGRPTSCPMLFCYFIWGKNDTNEWYLKNESLQSYPDKCKSFTFDYSTNKLTVTESDGDINTIFDCLIYTDIKDFDPNSLNVDVSFSPPLRGDVSREFEYNGLLQKLTSFNMTITNNSSKPIIYFMYIDSYDSSNPIVDNEGNWHNEFGHWSYPSDGVSFQFIKKEWVYSRNMDTQSSFSGTTADRWKKYYKPTFYHYLASGDSITQTFNWSQINIVANTNYYCLVGAQLTELDCGSDISNYDSDALNPEYKDFPITGFSPVYHSIFSLSDLSDIPYNPNDSSNGLIPNSDYRIEDSRYTMQFDASESMDGFLDYNSGDLYTDQNSWFNNKDVSSRPTVSGSGSFSFFSLIGGISNVYDFLRYSLSILPSEVYMIILSSIFIVIFIGIIKRLG